MNWLRALILPAAIATPLWLWLSPVPFRGMSALAEFPLDPRDLFFGAIFTLVGLLMIGLPCGSFVTRRAWPAVVKGAALLVAGAAGGWLVAMLYILLLVLGADGLNSESVSYVPIVAIYGVLPGVVVAVVWMALNFSDFKSRTRGNANG